VGRTIITDDGQFEWDEDKNAQNIEKHGIDFNFAKRVFDDEDRIRVELWYLRKKLVQ
jgi:uncharacterized DUF497 family protein